MNPDQLHHRFSFIALEAGEISPSQEALALNAPFLNTTAASASASAADATSAYASAADAAAAAAAADSKSPSPSPMEPADESILILSLTEDEKEEEIEIKKSPVKESEEKMDPVKELHPTVTKKSGEKRRSRGVKLGSSDSDEETAPPTTRRLPATLQEPKVVDKEKDFAVEIPTAQNPRKEKEKDTSGKTQSCCDNLPEVIKNPISAEKSDAGGSTETPKTKPPLDFNNYMDVLAAVFGEPDMSLENVDILEIAAMRGIHIEPPRWHRPGGYGPKPKDSKK